MNHGYYVDGVFDHKVGPDSPDVEPDTTQAAISHATIFLKDPTPAPNSWSKVYFYAWDDNGQLLGGWPGQLMTDTKVVNGQRFYCHTFDIANSDYTFNIIFNQGDGSHQTEDIKGLNRDTYFEIASTTNKYTVRDITDQWATPTGDVNGDGEVSIADVTALVAMVLSDLSNERSDVNGDGETGIADVTALVGLLLAQ